MKRLQPQARQIGAGSLDVQWPRVMEEAAHPVPEGRAKARVGTGQFGSKLMAVRQAHEVPRQVRSPEGHVLFVEASGLMA
jgi:hypothetical protein